MRSWNIPQRMRGRGGQAAYRKPPDRQQEHIEENIYEAAEQVDAVKVGCINLPYTTERYSPEASQTKATGKPALSRPLQSSLAECSKWTVATVRQIASNMITMSNM